MRSNVRVLRDDLPAYFVQRRAFLNAIGARSNREQEFWEMMGMLVVLFLLVGSVLVLVFK